MDALIKSLITLSDDTNCIIVRKPFIQFTGSLEAGMLLNQLLYWTPRSVMGGWIAKSDDEFSDELCLTGYAVRKSKEALERMGILETKLKKFNGAPTTHYRLKLIALEEKWGDFVKTQNQTCESGETITETTTEKSTPSASAGADKRENETFDEWISEVRDNKNKQAVIARMVKKLFPHQFPGDIPSNFYGYVAKTANHSRVKGYERLAQLVWQAASYRPTGDVMSYCLGLAKGQEQNGSSDERGNAQIDLDENGRRHIKVKV